MSPVSPAVSSKSSNKPKSNKNESLRTSLNKLVQELSAVFLERTELIKLLLTAYLGKSNLFIGGPPGTGKTMLAKAVASSFSTRSFYYLMGATTQPDEVLGAVDLSALQNGEFRRDLTGKVADVELAILDEIFKANSPSLNTLLGIILDHEIQNGKGIHKCPLISLVGCSNELPQEESLAPFWDRFTLRYWVEDVNHKNKRVLMQRAAGLVPSPSVTTQFGHGELETMQQEAQALPVSEEVIDGMLSISSRLRGEGVNASTRKHVQMVNLIRCYAYVCGENEVTEEHLGVLNHIFWSDTKERDTVAAVVREVVEAPYEKLNKTLAAGRDVINVVGGCDTSDATRYKAFLGGADSKLLEMLATVKKEIASSPVGSKKYKMAEKVYADLEKMRQKSILAAMAQVEFNF